MLSSAPAIFVDFSYLTHADDGDCMNSGYSIVRDVLSVVRRMDLGRNLAAHVIQCRSEMDARQFQVVEWAAK